MDIVSYLFAADRALFLFFAFLSVFASNVYVLIMLEKNVPKPKNNSGNPLPNLSVIVCAFNEQEHIADCIRSIQSSDYPKHKLQLIVVDDGSSDDTKTIAQSFPNITLLSGNHQGKAAGVNMALQQAIGTLVSIVDADTFVEPNALSEAARCFDSEKIAAVEGNVYVAKPSSFAQRVQSFEYYTMNYWSKANTLVNSLFVTFGQFTTYRKSVLDALGGFDTRNLTEDMEMALRLQTNGYEIVHADNATARTVVPDNFSKLFKQRTRWYRGSMSNAIKYKTVFFNPKHSTLGFFSMPLNMIFAFSAVFFFTNLAILVGGVIAQLGMVAAQSWMGSGTALQQIPGILSTLNLFPLQSALYVFSVLWLMVYFLLSARRANHEFALSDFPALLMLFSLYFYIQGMAWVNALRKELLGAERSWETKAFS